MCRLGVGEKGKVLKTNDCTLLRYRVATHNAPAPATRHDTQRHATRGFGSDVGIHRASGVLAPILPPRPGKKTTKVTNSPLPLLHEPPPPSLPPPPRRGSESVYTMFMASSVRKEWMSLKEGRSLQSLFQQLSMSS